VHRLQFRKLFSEPVANFTYSINELFVVLSRLGVMWDFSCYHRHITLNGSVVVHVHCIAVCVVLFLYREGFII
jgi:hypothetical protein